MKKLRKLPEAELEVMNAVWAEESDEITTPILTAALNESKNWTQQTVLTLLRRLEGRGFLTSIKLGKECIFSPTITKDEYVRFESEAFLKTFHKNSLAGLMRTLYNGKPLEDEDYDELKRFLDERKEN